MFVDNLDWGTKVFERLVKNPWLVTDTETVAISPYPKKDALVLKRMRIIVFSMCYKGESYSFPTNYLDPRFPSMPEWMHRMKKARILNNRRLIYVFHNANYDTNVFDVYDENLRWQRLWCTLICGWLAAPARDKSLKKRAPLYGRHLHKTETIDFKRIDDIGPYAEEDVIQTDESYQMQTQGYVDRRITVTHITSKGRLLTTPVKMPSGKIVIEGEHLDSFHRTFWRLQERPYLRAVLRAEKLGFPLNSKRIKQSNIEIKQQKEVLLRKIYRIAGEVFNIASQPAKVKILQKLKVRLPYVSRKTGKPSIAANALIKMQMSNNVPILALIQQYTALDKLSKYTDPKKGLTHYVNPKTGRIHSTCKTCGAVTGRTSNSNPNLTQIPSAKDVFGFKEAFVAPKGKSIICLDHRQLELRIMGILAGEYRMAEILNDPERDIHTETSQDFSVDRDPTAKQLNFLLQFAGTAWALAEKLTIEGVPTTPEQAQVYVDRYAQVRPRVVEYREELLRFHEVNGYIELLTGRHRGLENVNWDSYRERHKAETTLSNNVVQGSGQDMLKAAIIRCDPKCINVDRAMLNTQLEMTRKHRNLIRDYSYKIERVRRILRMGNVEHALQVHDEGIWFVDDSAAEECAHLIADVMVWNHHFPSIKPYIVKMAVEGGIGKSWKEAKGKNPLVKISAMAA